MLYYGQNEIYSVANMVYNVKLRFCSNIGRMKPKIGPLCPTPLSDHYLLFLTDCGCLSQSLSRKVSIGQDWQVSKHRIH